MTPHPDKKRAASLEVDQSFGTSLRAFSASDAEFSNTEVTPSASVGHGTAHMFSSGPANSSQTASPLAVHASAFPLAGTAEEADDEESEEFVCTRLPMPKPPTDASHDDHLEFIHYQLDCITETSGVVLNGLVMLGDRAQGGQAVVQMTRHNRCPEEYAVKFFAKRADFESEAALYRDQTCALFNFLPKPIDVVDNLDGEFADPSGDALPPCIVMERGESLDLWLQRAQPDWSQAFTMMYHLAKNLKALHDNGYAHRDLKPGNVMWQPSRNLWTLIDFGCAARMGTMQNIVPLTMAYAAPEVVSEYRKGSKQIEVHESVDAWSLGVVAFELLTGERAIKWGIGKEKMMDKIEGKKGQKLPWERNPMKPRLAQKLGMFRKLVLALLNRDPSKRPPMKTFCTACTRVLSRSDSMHVLDAFAPETTATPNAATPEAPPTPTGMLALPCGCEMLAVVAQELMKVGVCSKCGHRFPPTLGADSASDVSGRDFDSKAVSSDLDVSPSGQLAVRPESITNLKHLADCMSQSACIPDLSLGDRTLKLPGGAARVFKEAGQRWGDVEMWPLHADPSERNIREGLFSLGVMRQVGGECVVCLSGSGVTLRAGALSLGGDLNAALVLDMRSGCLHSIKVQGGLVVVHGANSDVLLQQCEFTQCTLVVLEGARVSLDRCTLTSDLICVFASGEGTVVKATGCTTINGTMQGVSVNNGAKFEATALTVSQFSTTGIEARGRHASLSLTSCNILEASVEASMEASVHRGARAILVHERAKATLRDVCIENAWAGIWVASQARTEASACMIGPCERYGAFAEGEGWLLLKGCEIAGIAAGDGMHVTGKGTVATGDHCRFERASAAGASARDGARLKLKYCQAEVNAMHGFLAKRGAAIKAIGCESDSDGVGVFADSDAHFTAVNIAVLNGNNGGIVATGGSVVGLLEASVAGCCAGAGVRASGENTDLKMWGGTVVHRTANAAVDVCSAAKATMQKVSVSAGTGAAFRVRDRRSFLRLVACQACVAPLGELPPPEPVRRAEMDALMHGGSNACNGTKDSHRVYVRSGGGMIKALDCEPELDPKPKTSKYPELVPSAIQQSRGPQHATGIVTTNTNLPSTSPTAPHRPGAVHAWCGAPAAPAGPAGGASLATQHSGGSSPWWGVSQSVPEDSVAPYQNMHGAHAAHVQFDAQRIPVEAAQQPAVPVVVQKKKSKAAKKMRNWLGKFVGKASGRRELHFEPGVDSLLAFSDELDESAFPLDPGNPYATTGSSFGGAAKIDFSPATIAQPPDIQSHMAHAPDGEGGQRYPMHDPTMHAAPPQAPADTDDLEKAGDDEERSGRLGAASDTSSDTSEASGELHDPHASASCSEEEERAKDLQAMLQHLKHSPDSQLPIAGTHFLYTSLPLPLPFPPGTSHRGSVTALAHCTDSNLQVAVTFYLRKERLDTEESLRMHPKLRNTVLHPSATDRNESGYWRTAADAAVPPHTITPRGGLQSLSQWAHSTKPRFTSSIQVMCGVVSKLAALHALGYTHGRVASHGIVRMLHDVNHNVCEARWLLRSLNFVTNIGSKSPLPAATEITEYTPPEQVLAATSRGAILEPSQNASKNGLSTGGTARTTATPVDTAADIWALGIMLLELVTGCSARTGVPTHACEAPVDTADMGAPLDTAALESLKRAACGRAGYPWEYEVKGSVGLLAKLRGVKRIVLACLARDPTARPSAQNVLEALAAFAGDGTVLGLEDSDDEDAHQEHKDNANSHRSEASTEVVDNNHNQHKESEQQPNQIQNNGHDDEDDDVREGVGDDSASESDTESERYEVPEVPTAEHEALTAYPITTSPRDDAPATGS